MKAIMTKWSPPAHITASDGDTRRRFPQPGHLHSIEQRHMWAACEFARSKGWTGELAQGFVSPGRWAHVFIDGPFAHRVRIEEAKA
jgi:hypothetical protein